MGVDNNVGELDCAQPSSVLNDVVFNCNIRQSAGILSPTRTYIISPGTSSLDGILPKQQVYERKSE